jgi:hypothetical protein
MSRLAVIALLYTAFAIIATGVNLSLQWLSLRYYQGHFHLPAAMVVGTCAGLVTKYLLEFCSQTPAQFFGIRIDRRGDDCTFLGL